MELSTALQLVTAVCALLVAIVTWGYRSGSFLSGETGKLAALQKDHDDFKMRVERRFDDAGEHMSDLATKVQGMESRFLREFATISYVDSRFRDSAADRERIHQDLTALRAERHGGTHGV